MDELDRILSSEEPLMPSSGFAAGVMHAVREAHAAPPPLPYPWGRLVVGALACGVWAVSAIALAASVDFTILGAAFSELAPVALHLGVAAGVMAASFGALHVQKTMAER